ncbi:hypothetical protein HUZ36_00085 [Pseudoalteromonas sp. McH1-7]|uniref:Secreted protein n=1 Tax=Pseudoalteromonas peptidolytica F12-50-A1 TaxID=1315280 RepID=A0A8I0MVD0_9GAMM|nr:MULTISPECIES: hypothetical protein [Pseudoalteromonas]MBE0346491.1 hypothetical protein [Pseudoalteromonas peptidolytica F12-50-A1]MDW7550626.1 hypothetical protein [Pseudoalteromonas peptidolytica]NLR14570.1 hypothetical protein [Pseudoalteromonas peptidolytica]NUZ09166.1 hypothetical protein [Pseudoalteromonas sp. McH1-7]RRS09666.1 hypothetical protein EAG18_05870 [Pseudoalteromonas sp. J010]
MKKLITALAAFVALSVSAQETQEAKVQVAQQNIKIVAIGQSGWDPIWREPTCSIQKTDEDAVGNAYMINHYDMCLCQNSKKASYLIEDTQSNPKQAAVICYLEQ